MCSCKWATHSPGFAIVWRGVDNGGAGHGTTLEETRVSEGLACAFEMVLRPGLPPFFAMALNDVQLASAREECERRTRAQYDHAAGLFGSDATPRRAERAQGFHLA
jgi:uncharacterized protein YjaZ